MVGAERLAELDILPFRTDDGLKVMPGVSVHVEMKRTRTSRDLGWRIELGSSP